MSEPRPIQITALAAQHIRTAEEWWRENRQAAPNAVRLELQRAFVLIGGRTNGTWSRCCVGLLKFLFVERVGQMFGSFEDAETADDQFYADLTPEERLDILLELVDQHRSALGEAASRLERVHRIIELSQR
jgi:hypothetical protein